MANNKNPENNNIGGTFEQQKAKLIHGGATLAPASPGYGAAPCIDALVAAVCTLATAAHHARRGGDHLRNGAVAWGQS